MIYIAVDPFKQKKIFNRPTDRVLHEMVLSTAISIFFILFIVWMGLYTAFDIENKKMVTVTAVQPSGRFGALNLDSQDLVSSFLEKPKGDGAWINGGFFVLNPEVFSYLQGDMNNMMWEDEPLEKLTSANQLVAFQHSGFWKCMDALRDKLELEELWQSGQAKWKTW